MIYKNPEIPKNIDLSLNPEKLSVPICIHEYLNRMIPIVYSDLECQNL